MFLAIMPLRMEFLQKSVNVIDLLRLGIQLVTTVIVAQAISSPPNVHLQAKLDIMT